MDSYNPAKYALRAPPPVPPRPGASPVTSPRPKPNLAPLPAHHSPPATSAPDEPHVTVERYAAGAAVVSSPPQAPSPYQPESGASPHGPPPPAGPPPPSGSLSGMESAVTRREPPSQPQSKTPPRPPIQYNAPTEFTLRQCPSTEYTFTGEGQWYFHPQVPDFRICTYCYEKHIQSTRLECEFYAWTCPRIEDDIWPRAVHSGNLTKLLGFFARRLIPATENMKWYQPRDKQRFPEFLACQACYEDVLLSGALRDEFVLFSGPQAKETLFICDAANPYVRKLATKTNSMDAFISGTIRHLHLHECAKNGALTDGPSRKWYQPRNSSSSSSSITICERCYGEYVAHTEFETSFHPVTRPNAQHRCMLGLWQSRSVWDEALAHHDFTLWERTMLEMNSGPLCTLEIARANPVYQLPGVENFDLCPKLNLVSGRQWYGNESCRICPACYEEVVRDSYLASYFPPTPITIHEETCCDLYSPRMRSKFTTACTTQDATPFLSFATHRKNVYHQTVPEMRALVERAQHNLSMQKMYNTTSSAYNNMDGISTVGMYDSGIRYTGSGVPGMFRTHWGVEGAAMGQTAMGYMQQTQVDAARVRYLQGVWDAVE
ncbi:hypothetical protein BJX68DRAFT_277274 [Aspergillus pseudodeflectus]|uniref:Integral membrane protein n=1 Tax=Aspergillus pseudodeflectus TaxID=176178 RepID=A0ABR4JZM3_9EURO